MIIQWKWFCDLFGISGITLFPFIIVGYKNDQTTINHERIHFKQCLKYFIIGFYLIYLIDYLRFGYYGIRFETEAYLNEDNPDYKP